MVYLIAFREDTWFAPLCEFQLWNHLALAYGAQAQLIRNWSDVALPEGTPIIVAHEGGEIESRIFQHPENAAYVFGHTGLDLMGAVPHYDHLITIATPDSAVLWGVQVAAMILRDRQFQAQG